MTKQAQTNDDLPGFLRRASRGAAKPVTQAIANLATKGETAIPEAKPKAKSQKAEAKPKAKRASKRKAAPVKPRQAKGSVVPAAFKAKAGKTGIMNGDAIGMAIKNAFLAAGNNDEPAAVTARRACDALLKENGLDVGRWPGKNPGMLRMNVTNVLRGLHRNGKDVKVRGKVFKAA